ncbi:MAG: HAD hydrolase-like protein [Lachnospiraceae bacterium]|nr:HAD hydrolase-like protein [Lachnospiraceae bacterium]
MKNYRYIFWDLDGTVTDSYEGVSKCLLYAFKEYDVKVMGEKADEHTDYRRFIGPPFRESFPKYTDVSDDMLETVIEKYRERYNPIGVFECAIFPGVRETLIELREKGMKNVLTSSKPERACRDILKKFDIDGLFDEIVGATPDGRIDTKAEVLNEAFRRLKEADGSYKKEDTVLIGDTKYDAEGAKKAGIDCVGVTYGFGTGEELTKAGAYELFQNQETLREALTSRD